MLKIKSKIDELLEKEVTRKQFIVSLGLATLSLFGFSTIIGALSEPDKTEAPGYGINNYGP